MNLIPEVLPAESSGDGSFRACEELDPESNRVIVRLLGVRVELRLCLKIPGHDKPNGDFWTCFDREETRQHQVTVLHLLDHMDWALNT